MSVFTESQNHRILGVGRGFCWSSSPIPLPNQGRLQQVAQDLVQAGLEYLQRRRLHNLTGQPVPVLRHPQSEEILPHVPINYTMSFVLSFPLPFQEVYSPGTTKAFQIYVYKLKLII